MTTAKAKILNLPIGQVSYRHRGSGARKILFFHGFPGSSSQIQIFEKFIQSHDLEVLSFDRPGYNQTILKNDRLAAHDLPATLELAREFVQSFGWKNFEIFSVSGGTPSALSFAQKFPHSVLGLHVVCGLGALQELSVGLHYRKSILWGLRILPFTPGWILKKALLSSARRNQRAQNPLLNYFLPSSKTDFDFMSLQEVRQTLNISLTEAMAQNALGPKQDARVFLSNWGEKLKSFSHPIHFWHGEEDHVLPHQMSERMAEIIPKARFRKIPGEGHISLPGRSMKTILDDAPEAP